MCISQYITNKPNRRGIDNSGGGESDAAFTPSPPAPIGNESVRILSHQSKIRNLYPTINLVGNDVHPILQTMYQRRPDSSSSASSATDWEGNCLP